MKPAVDIPLCEKAELVFLAIFKPKIFIEKEIEHNAKVDEVHLQRSSDQSLSRIDIVRTSLGTALLICIVSSGIGAILGTICSALFGQHPKTAALIIITGTGILLWATLALQGWPIQSIKGETLAERVNQWIFRALYSLGTVLISYGSVWSVF